MPLVRRLIIDGTTTNSQRERSLRPSRNFLSSPDGARGNAADRDRKVISLRIAQGGALRHTTYLCDLCQASELLELHPPAR